MPMVAPSVQEAQVGRLVPTAHVARLGMVFVDHADVLVRVERNAAFGAGIALVLLGKAVEAVTKDERQLAKAVNFGLLYGQGVKVIGPHRVVRCEC